MNLLVTALCLFTAPPTNADADAAAVLALASTLVSPKPAPPVPPLPPPAKPPAVPVGKACDCGTGCPNGGKENCKDGCRCAAVSSTDVAYSWMKDANGRNWHALYSGGKQVGGWNPVAGVYRPLDNGKWGDPCVPPLPVPAQPSYTVGFSNAAVFSNCANGSCATGTCATGNCSSGSWGTPVGGGRRR